MMLHEEWKQKPTFYYLLRDKNTLLLIRPFRSFEITTHAWCSEGSTAVKMRYIDSWLTGLGLDYIIPKLKANGITTPKKLAQLSLIDMYQVGTFHRIILLRSK
jgi:hypothetical protein